jgi:hypothetical protein
MRELRGTRSRDGDRSRAERQRREEMRELRGTRSRDGDRPRRRCRPADDNCN